MPVDAILVFWEGGRAVLGDDAQRIADDVSRRPGETSNSTFYVEREDALYLVAVVPLDYRNEQIAQVAVAINLGSRWLNRHFLSVMENYSMPRPITLIMRCWIPISGTLR